MLKKSFEIEFCQPRLGFGREVGTRGSAQSSEPVDKILIIGNIWLLKKCSENPKTSDENTETLLENSTEGHRK